MKSFTLTRQHYELLWIAGISVVIISLIFILIKEDLFRESTIERHWKIVYDESADKVDRVNALQYLARQKESLADLNFPGEQNFLRGLNLSSKALEIKTGIRIDEKHADLMRANFSNADLTDANLSETNLSGANLSGANLTNSHFHNVDLSSANLSGANLSGTKLSGTDLTDANLSGAKLFGTSFISAKLTDTKLYDAKLFAVDFTFANLNNLILNKNTVIDYSYFWKNSSEENPIIYLPTGTPENWDTTLKPAYICAKNYMFIDIDAAKDQIKREIEKRCKPYVHQEEPEISQEESDEPS